MSQLYRAVAQAATATADRPWCGIRYVETVPLPEDQPETRQDLMTTADFLPIVTGHGRSSISSFAALCAASASGQLSTQDGIRQHPGELSFSSMPRSTSPQR